MLQKANHSDLILIALSVMLSSFLTGAAIAAGYLAFGLVIGLFAAYGIYHIYQLVGQLF